MAGAAADRSREVRIAVADGLAALAAELTETGHADAREALERLAGDRDVLVRAAAFKAAGALGCPPPLDTLAVRVLRRRQPHGRCARARLRRWRRPAPT